MSLIRPGIHENLMISPKTKWNDKGSYDFVIAAAQSENAELAAFENNAVSIAMESTLKFYSINMIDYEKNVKTSADIGEELRIIRYQFMKYGELFAPKETVESYLGGTKMFEGLGIAPQDYGRALIQLTNKEFCEKVFKNLANKFHQLLTAANAFSGQVLFRQKFLRQSKDKNWAVIPNTDISEWLEPMTIPLAESKIAFTDWEKKNKKDDPNPSVSSKKENKTEADVNAGKNLFGATTQATAPPILSTPPPLPGAVPVPAVVIPVVEAPVIPAMAPPPIPVVPAPIVETPAIIPVAPIVPPVVPIAPPVIPAVAAIPVIPVVPTAPVIPVVPAVAVVPTIPPVLPPTQ